MGVRRGVSWWWALLNYNLPFGVGNIILFIFIDFLIGITIFWGN